MLKVLTGVVALCCVLTIVIAAADHVRLRRDNPQGSVRFETGMDVLVAMSAAAILGGLVIATRTRIRSWPHAVLALGVWVLGLVPVLLVTSHVLAPAPALAVSAAIVLAAMIAHMHDARETRRTN